MDMHRIMVIGSKITTVQRVSRHCLEQGADVFPYYGIPTNEEVSLFAPEIVVLCLPVTENFQRQIEQPYILWSEKSTNGLPLVSTPTELQSRLQELLRA